jgi:hypothetical protein
MVRRNMKKDTDCCIICKQRKNVIEKTVNVIYNKIVTEMENLYFEMVSSDKRPDCDLSIRSTAVSVTWNIGDWNRLLALNCKNKIYVVYITMLEDADSRKNLDCDSCVNWIKGVSLNETFRR